MEEEFELPVEYKGAQLMLNASLLVTGYTHKFNVDANGHNIIFEPDEERNYRAVINCAFSNWLPLECNRPKTATMLCALIHQNHTKTHSLQHCFNIPIFLVVKI